MDKGWGPIRLKRIRGVGPRRLKRIRGGAEEAETDTGKLTRSRRTRVEGGTEDAETDKAGTGEAEMDKGGPMRLKRIRLKFRSPFSPN